MTSATPLAPLPRLPHVACLARPLSLDSLVPLTADTRSLARQQFSSLEDWLSAPTTLQLPLHQIECPQEHTGRELQRLLLQTHIQQRGNGDVGPALRVVQGVKPAIYSHRRLHTRLRKTIFGPVRITRMSYSRAGAASIHPLDEALQLPARSFSYERQKRMVKAAVQGTPVCGSVPDFREAQERIAEISGAPVPTRSIEEVIQDAAEDLDAFYAQRTLEPWTDTGSILVAAVDGKGIPMIKPDGAQPRVRLTKGQKANRKKMRNARGTRVPRTVATVAAVFTRAPWIRTPEQVVESLFGRDHPLGAVEKPAPRPEHKRVCGTHVTVGQLDDRPGRRDCRGSRRGVTARSARPQDPRGAHRRRASPADSGQRKAGSHFDPRSAPRTGEAG